jgi:cell wall-associated NlpC family hydrolase
VTAERLIRLSREQLGTPYRYGGSSPTEGFDCSGLVHYVHARNGLYVPRSARDQFRSSTAVPLSAIRPGDLLFFRISGDKPGHVGIYIGRGRFIHAPSPGRVVSQTSLNTPYWQSRLIGAGRFI